MKPLELIVILGPTASGKTKLAAQVAYRLDGEVLSADSRQVYRGLDIGTGKDLKDYEVEDTRIPYHLIDICDPREVYNVNRYQEDFNQAFHEILTRNRNPILCGGTGLYLEAVLEQYQLTAVPEDLDLRKEISNHSDEELIGRVKTYQFPEYFAPDCSTRKRIIRAIEVGEYLSENGVPESPNISFVPVIFGLKHSREERRKKITDRLQYRLENGLIGEVERLMNDGISTDKLRYFGLEYKFVTDYLEGLMSRDELFEKLNVAIHQYAKRQMTWFRRMERRGHKIHWIDANSPVETMVDQIVDKLCG